jgi:hypothetical protein
MKKYPWEDVAIQQETEEYRQQVIAMQDFIRRQTMAYLGSMHLELLDVLAVGTGCEYMSDLHLKEHSDELSVILDESNHFPVYRYSLADWQEALRYITGTQKEVSTIEEALSILREGVIAA